MMLGMMVMMPSTLRKKLMPPPLFASRQVYENHEMSHDI